MAIGDINFQGASDRWMVWLRPYSAKQLALWFDSEPRTAKAWKAGQWPLVRHLLRMLARWGMPFIDTVFGPVWRENDQDLLLRLERMRLEFDAITVMARGGSYGGIQVAARCIGSDPAGSIPCPPPGQALRLVGRRSFQGRRRAAALGYAAVNSMKACLIVVALCGTAAPHVYSHDQGRAPRTARPPLVRMVRTVHATAGRA